MRMMIWIRVGRMCNASLALSQKVIWWGRKPGLAFLHPWQCLYCLGGVKFFLKTVVWSLMLEDARTWSLGVYPHNIIVRWGHAVLSAQVLWWQEKKLRSVKQHTKDFIRNLGQSADFDLVFCGSFLLACWMPVRPSFAFLSITAS